MYAPDEDVEEDVDGFDDVVPDRVTWRADEDEDAVAARARRRLEMAHALAEMSLRMAAAVEARAVAAMEAEAPAPDPLFGDVGLVFTRVMRAARLSLALEARLDGEQQAQVLAPGDDPNDPPVIRLTRSEYEANQEKLIDRLAQKRRGDIYNIISHVVGVEARELGREREVETLLFNAHLWDEVNAMSKGDENFLNHDMGALVIQACERVGLALGKVFAGLPDFPEAIAAGRSPPFRDRDHPS